jgi:hypothetical protein
LELEPPVTKFPDAPTQSEDGPDGTLGVLTFSKASMFTVKHGVHPDTTPVCDEQRARARTQYDPASQLC